MKYFLDTNIISYAIRGDFENLPKHFMKVPAQSIVIPTIVMAEIEYGARKSKDYSKTKKAYSKFIDAFDTVSFKSKAAEEYGKVRAELEKEGKKIGPNDLVIAATVLSENGVLVTHNVKEFSRIEGLKIEDWTE